MDVKYYLKANLILNLKINVIRPIRRPTLTINGFDNEFDNGLKETQQQVNGNNVWFLIGGGICFGFERKSGATPHPIYLILHHQQLIGLV